MEHSLLSPHDCTLKEGIPFRLIRHLVKGGRYHDVNLQKGFTGDEDLEEINAMEASLGPLAPEQEDIRVACDFCCIWRYDYPKRVHEICAIIGGSPDTSLRLHYQICPEKRQELIDYAEALKGWLEGKSREETARVRPGSEETASKVYRFLGSDDPIKRLLVERTYFGLSARALNCTFWGNISAGPPVALLPFTAQPLPANWRRLMTDAEQAIKKKMGPGAGDFLCDVGGTAEPACHFKFVRRVDILVSSIGCLKWRGNLPPKDGHIKGRRQVTAAYMKALEQYWRTGSRTGDQPLEEDLFGLLGKPSDFKRWLVACLWKNIKNQTQYQAYPMKHWVEFVRIGEDYLQSINR